MECHINLYNVLSACIHVIVHAYISNMVVIGKFIVVCMCVEVASKNGVPHKNVLCAGVYLNLMFHPDTFTCEWISPHHSKKLQPPTAVVSFLGHSEPLRKIQEWSGNETIMAVVVCATTTT